GDERKAVDPLDERVFDRLAEAAGKIEEPGGRQILPAEEDHEVIEPGAPDRGDRIVIDLARQIDAGDFCTDRPGEWVDSQRIAMHQSRVPHATTQCRPGW